MLVIANNISTRSAKTARMFKEMDGESLQNLVKECVKAGADMVEINLQQRYDKPEVMEFAVKSAQQVTDCQLCLSTNSPETLEAGLKLCKRPPLVNYVTVDVVKLRSILPIIANHGAQVLLLITQSPESEDAETLVKKAAILVGAANEAGIPNDDIVIDPGLIHITSDQGQSHFTRVVEFMRAVPDLFSPPVKTTCWLANSSAGAPERFRPVIEAAVLTFFSGLGLSSVFMDVFKRVDMRAVRLNKILNNELVYSDGELEL